MPKTNIFDRFSFYTFAATILLLPFFFLPFMQFSIPVAKGIIFAIGITLSFLLWIIGRLADGRLVLPKSRILLAGLIIVLAFFLSAIMSASHQASFLGVGFEVGTFGTIALCFLAMFLAANFFRDKKNNFQMYLGLSISFALVSLSVIVNLIAGPTSHLAQVLPINLLGGWNDLAVFSGLVIIFSLLSIEFLPAQKKYFKIISISLIAVALFMLALVNFYSVWVVVGIISLFVFIFSFISSRQGKTQPEFPKFPAASFSVIIISLVFIIANSLIGGFLSSRLHLDNTEVKPSISTTFEVAKQSLAKSPVLGSGPNRFLSSWLQFKPDAVNQTLFWDSNFNYGFGLIPTFAVTAGLFGLLAFIAFFVLLLVAGYKSLNKISSMNFGSPTIFLSALFLWIFAVIHNPNLVIFALAFILTGAFIGTLGGEKQIKNYEVSFLKDPRLSFFSILILIGLIAGSVGAGYSFVKKFVSIVYFQKSALSQNTPEGLTSASNYLLKAISLDQNNDLYYRYLSQVYLIELNNLVNQKDGNPEELKAKIQSALNQAEASAQAATIQDPTNYQNYLSLAGVYEQVLPLGVAGAYDNAKAAIEKALVLNPKNPGLYVRLATLEIAGKNIDQAEQDINLALQLRPNDSDLLNYLAQIKAQKEINLAPVLSPKNK